MTSNAAPSTVDLAAARAELFRLLAVGFLHPSPELASGLVDGAFQADLRACVTMLDWPVAEAERVAARLDDAKARLAARDPDAVYHELAVEYSRLFIGPGTIVVSPYESIHLDGSTEARPLVMVSRSSRAVLAAYREAGLERSRDGNEPPEHIATELEFMYFVCFREAAALAEEDETASSMWENRRVAFLSEHLQAWLPGLCRTVADESRVPFYVDLAETLASTIEVETGRSG
jgi:DMSO reductase family type II enzyme chaperone